MAARKKKPAPKPAEPRCFLDDPAARTKLLKELGLNCLLSFITDFGFLVSSEIDKHEHLKWESWVGFYGIFGFVACIIIVLVAKYILRPISERKEDFYDE